MSMRYLKTFLMAHTLLIVLCASVLVQAASAQKPGPAFERVANSNNECAVCHTVDAEHKLLSLSGIKKSSKCVGCHNNSVNSQKASMLLAANTASENKKESTASSSEDEIKQDVLRLKHNKLQPTQLNLTAGMRFPMYTQGSRLGDDPSEMALIEAGEFVMGSNDRLPDEGPQHKVTLKAYYIDIYEVTNMQYQKFNNMTKRRSPRHFRNRSFPEGKADHPVTYVSWNDASDYCKWAGKRLPTDQEWEKAARGTDARIFPWGNEFDVKKANTPLRWQRIGRFGDTTPVGAFAEGVSPYGVYDMSGNVWEWTASWYKPYPNNKTPSESYGERYKTLKGGSWFDCSFYNCGISAPVFNRAFFSKRTKNDSFGFRCAKDAE